MIIHRCGGCHFAKLIGQDITKRVCGGAPPTAIQVPAPGGQMTFRMARPIVDISDEACALFRPKDGVDKQRDDAGFKQLADMKDAEAATKQ